MNIAAFSCNFRTATLDVLEALSLSRERIAELYKKDFFAEFEECVLISTCNRVEIYVKSDENPTDRIAEKLAGYSGISAETILRNAAVFSGVPAIKHLLEVVAGLDSRMVGETEILGQVKQAYETAYSSGKTGATLNRIFQKSFHAAKWARSETGISQGQISIGNVAVELAGRVFGDLSRCSILIVGTGEAGRKTAQAFVSRGAENVLVASRDFERAHALANEIGAGAVETDSVAARMIRADIVVGCTSTEKPLISKQELMRILKSRCERPLFLIDLGMPRNFPADTEADSLWLYGLEDLAAIANENLSAREREAELCREELTRRARRIFDAL